MPHVLSDNNLAVDLIESCEALKFSGFVIPLWKHGRTGGQLPSLFSLFLLSLHVSICLDSLSQSPVMQGSFAFVWASIAVT